MNARIPSTDADPVSGACGEAASDAAAPQSGRGTGSGAEWGRKPGVSVEMLGGHTFQFVSFCHVWHPLSRCMSTVQVNPDCHLLHVTRGRGVITLDMQHHCELQRGVVVAIPRGMPFTMRLAPRFEMLNLHYQIWLADGRHVNEVLRLPYCFRPGAFSLCEQWLRDMAGSRSATAAEALRSAALAHRLVLEHYTCCELLPAASRVSDPRIARVARHLMAPGCTRCEIKTLERLAGLGRSQINRAFVATYGLPPHAFWEKHLLRRVCTDLKQDGRTVAEVSRDHGFSSPQYFSRWFCKHTSCSPTQFRETSVCY